MKKILPILVIAIIGCSISWVVATNRMEKRHSALLAEQQAAWTKEKTELEDALRKASRNSSTVHQIQPAAELVTLPTHPTPKEIIATLQTVKASGSSRNTRFAIARFENLIEAGTNALPAIREFLTKNEDIDYSSWGDRGRSRGVPSDFVLPPSLRFGLFDVVKQIGGADAEKLLADVLQTTGRGMEVAYLVNTLQEIAPNKYRESALAVAHDLLDHPASSGQTDKYERDYLFGVLSLYGDTSLVSTVQGQLIQPDGGLDRAALKYLQKSLGEQALPIAAATYADPRLAPDRKENVARIGLYYAGTNPEANQLFDTAVRDESLSVDARRNFIEDLNQDGIKDERNPTAGDLKLIEARLRLIESYNGKVENQRMQAAFKEAYKDLSHMYTKGQGTTK